MECGVYQVLEKTSEARPMAQWLLCTDDTQEAIDLLVRHAKEKHLPLIRDPSTLKNPFWVTQRRRSAAEAAKDMQ